MHKHDIKEIVFLGKEHILPLGHWRTHWTNRAKSFECTFDL